MVGTQGDAMKSLLLAGTTLIYREGMVAGLFDCDGGDRIIPCRFYLCQIADSYGNVEACKQRLKLMRLIEGFAPC